MVVLRSLRIYLDFADWWIGYYRGPNHHYVCLLPCLVIRWSRQPMKSSAQLVDDEEI